MKKFIKKSLLLLGFFLAFSFQSKATHIVGGDITVQSLGSNNFQITLTLFFDCINGSPAAFDPIASVGIYDKVTNVLQQCVSISFTDSVNLALGDTCYSPPNMCVRKQRYITTVIIPNNPNGYYLEWARCCRNSIISNIVNPGGSGNIFYTEIPDPALSNSSPTFVTYPDAYMCVNYPNIDNFTATDIDNDSLVYSLSDPLDCATNNICSSISPMPGCAPGPYGTIPWMAPYSLTNITGASSMSVNQTGILSTVNPPTLGIFVFCVKVEEFDRTTQAKLGEIRRDVQYSVQPCAFPSVNVSGPNPICLGESTTMSASGGNNYSWNTGATTGTIIVTPTSAGTYTFAVTTTVNSNCHVNADTVITVNPGTTATAAGSPTTICAGQNSTLTAAGNGNYLWNTGATTDTLVVSPTVTTNYIVTVTNSFGCTAMDTVTVSVANLQVNGNNPLCLGESSTLTASGGTAYSWNTGATSTSISVQPTAVGSYTFTVDDPSLNCPGSFVVIVNQNAVATAATADDTICIGMNTTLTATGGGTYNWAPSTGLSCTACSNPTASPVVTTDYTVTVTNTSGCTATAAVTIVAVSGTLNPQITGDNVLCLGESTTLTASGGITYSWLPGGSTATSIVITPGSAATYTLYAYSACGNGSDTLPISVNPIPYLSAIASSTICPGDSATLNANAANGTTPYTYYWTPPNNLSNPNAQNPHAAPVTTTPYVVTVTDANGCTDDTSTTVYVQTVPSITWAEWTPALTCDGYTIPLKANVSSNGQSVFWDFGDGSSTTTYAPNTDAGPHTYPFNGTYSITVTVFNLPCKSSLDTTITISDISGFVNITPANVFTPNEDGTNDCFHPAMNILQIPNNMTADSLEAALGECVYLEVFDRWGIKMFETSDIEKCWSGKTLKGHPAKDGTYYYIAKFGDVVLKGFIELLR